MLAFRKKYNLKDIAGVLFFLFFYFFFGGGGGGGAERGCFMIPVMCRVRRYSFLPKSFFQHGHSAGIIVAAQQRKFSFGYVNYMNCNTWII